MSGSSDFSVTPPRHDGGVLDELVAVVEALDALAAVDPAELADSESVLVLQRQRARLEAISARGAASWDARQGWAVDDARSGAHARHPAGQQT